MYKGWRSPGSAGRRGVLRKTDHAGIDGVRLMATRARLLELWRTRENFSGTGEGAREKEKERRTGAAKQRRLAVEPLNREFRIASLDAEISDRQPGREVTTGHGDARAIPSHAAGRFLCYVGSERNRKIAACTVNRGARIVPRGRSRVYACTRGRCKRMTGG